MRRALLRVAAGTICGLCAVSARAQTVTAGRWEVSAGAEWYGGASFGGSDATETSSGGGGFTLFTTSSTLGSATGGVARADFRLSRLIQLEGEVWYARPALRTSISGDTEQAAPVTASESVQQIVIGGAVVADVPRWRLGRQGVPFVSAGAGYLRQLHEGRTLVATGRTYAVGGGVRFLLRSRPAGRVKALGLRADVRAVARTKGVALDGRTHVSPVVAVSLFARF